MRKIFDWGRPESYGPGETQRQEEVTSSVNPDIRLLTHDRAEGELGNIFYGLKDIFLERHFF